MSWWSNSTQTNSSQVIEVFGNFKRKSRCRQLTLLRISNIIAYGNKFPTQLHSHPLPSASASRKSFEKHRKHVCQLSSTRTNTETFPQCIGTFLIEPWYDIRDFQNLNLNVIIVYYENWHIYLHRGMLIVVVIFFCVYMVFYLYICIFKLEVVKWWISE